MSTLQQIRDTIDREAKRSEEAFNVLRILLLGLAQRHGLEPTEATFTGFGRLRQLVYKIGTSKAWVGFEYAEDMVFVRCSRDGAKDLHERWPHTYGGSVMPQGRHASIDKLAAWIKGETP